MRLMVKRVLYCAVSFIDDCVTSSMTSLHVNSSSTSIHLTDDRGHLALYRGTDTSRSDRKLSNCHWSLEAPSGRSIIVAWKISLGGWTATVSGQNGQYSNYINMSNQTKSSQIHQQAITITTKLDKRRRENKPRIDKC